MVVVVVEWLIIFKRIIIVRGAHLSELCSMIFVGKTCVFVSRPMKIVTFLRKTVRPTRVVDFPRERDTFRNKFMEIVEDFDEKSYNNNGEPSKSSRILRVKPNFFNFSCFFIFFHFLSFSFIFFHFLSGCSKSDFFGPQFRYDFSSHFSKKNLFFSSLFFLLFPPFLIFLFS